MSEPNADSASPAELARLLGWSSSAVETWRDDELGAILRHQLSVPIDSTAGDPLGASPPTFSEAILGKDSRSEDLESIKLFAKTTSAGPDAALPREVASVIYLAAISAALVYHDKRITQLVDEVLEENLNWAASLPWLDEQIGEVFRAALAKLAAKPTF